MHKRQYFLKEKIYIHTQLLRKNEIIHSIQKKPTKGSTPASTRKGALAKQNGAHRIIAKDLQNGSKRSSKWKRIKKHEMVPIE